MRNFAEDFISIGEIVTIPAEATTANVFYIGYRNDMHEKFIRLEMFDDGIYGTNLEMTDNTTQNYVYAENDDVGKFSPVRAEHEY